MKKVVIFAFQGEAVCFAHAMLNVLDLSAKGHKARLVIEGAACKLIGDLKNSSHPQHPLYTGIIAQGLLGGVCRACCHQMGTLEEAEAQGLPLLSDMKGHPSMEEWLQKGYELISL
ncbi:MAG: hypothetical protein PQJ50_17320 [Spirochaetales bacterium]|nr:hypothetical protein [Spirochaetales bacterium]